MDSEAIVLQSSPVISGKFRLQWEEVQDAWVLLYPEGMVKLNQSAGEILKRLDGKKQIFAIISELEREFDTNNLKSDVLAFLDIANKQGWIKYDPKHG